MKKYLVLILVMFFSFGLVIAQDEEATKKKKDRPVRSMFESSILIDDQTSVIPVKNTLEMHIQHRFGVIKDNGISDLFGIYAPSANTRMGLNYSILNNLMLGYGITRINNSNGKMISDFQVKWNILQQTRKNTIPLNLTLYANMAIDGRNENLYQPDTANLDYQFANRLSYFTQVMVGRKFAEWFSLELHFSWTHYNAVSAVIPNVEGYEHDIMGVGGHMRFKFSPQSSILIMYTAPIFIKGMAENEVVMNNWYSNFGIAYEVATSTHAFQMFVTTANGIIPQDIYMYNNSQWTKTEIRIGFNITRLWSF